MSEVSRGAIEKVAAHLSNLVVDIGKKREATLPQTTSLARLLDPSKVSELAVNRAAKEL